MTRADFMSGSLGNSGLQSCCCRGKGRVMALNVAYVDVGYRSALMKAYAAMRNDADMSRMDRTYILT